MRAILYVVKIILAFWVCKIIGELIAESVVILIHFAFGKNILKGEIFAPQTITLITYYDYYNGVFKSIDFIYQRKSIHELHNFPVRFALI